LVMEQDTAVSPYEITDLKADRGFRVTLPILVLLFTPITVVYESLLEPTISIFFLIGRVYYRPISMHLIIELFFDYPITFLVISVPALIATIVSSWMLRRLSNKSISSRGASLVIAGVTVVWALYLSIYFFGSLSIGHLFVGPFPLPFGPIAAIFSQEYIMKLTEQIDELERSNSGLVDS